MKDVRGFDPCWERFTKAEKTKIKRLKKDDFEELLSLFSIWGRSKAPLTRLQIRSLGIRALKIGIDPYRQSTFKNKQTRWRDVRSWQFVKNPS